MIVYELRCSAGHGFEAWFRNSDAYDQQHAAHQISCAICGTDEVSKAPMAPRIAKSRGEAVPVQNTPAPQQGQFNPGSMNPEQMRMVMTKIAELNKHIADTCDYVGKNFAEEARKIHYGEVDHHEIYGEATPNEAEELRDEGIAVASVPWIRRSDS
ncbi:MAG TPA: DUF1178 family protein [Alphaproteobacteria bacterium]|jgi:hypothetical protein|nr:DUF1178 family protein [Alphaproteobacteria bacterium]